MVEPTHFDVTYVINPHMEGKVGTVDKAKCMDQWWMVSDARNYTVTPTMSTYSTPRSHIIGQCP
jgi:hypothetical protein